jgi:hypothetical protein
MGELRPRIQDLSRCDFHAATRLVAAGYKPETIRCALRMASPDLKERKRGHIEDYVRRTVDAAISEQQRRIQREQSSKRNRDV